MNTLSLEVKQMTIRNKIHQKLANKDGSIVIGMEDLYHDQYRNAGAKPVKLASLHHFPSYPKSQYDFEDIVARGHALINDFKYDLNRPILVVSGFPIKELPLEVGILIKDERRYVVNSQHFFDRKRSNNFHLEMKSKSLKFSRRQKVKRAM